MPKLTGQKRRSKGVLIGLALVTCLLGLLLSHLPQMSEGAFAQGVQDSQILRFPANTTTDRVPPDLEAGQSLYVQHCGTCHLALPPAVLPTQTWDQLLRDPSHYGVMIEPLPQPQQSWVRRYLIFASRLLRDDELTPYRVQQSRYFKLLHYEVDLPTTINTDSCVTCHAKAPSFNFRL